MTRQDLRNRAPKRALPLATVLKRLVLGALLLAALVYLWELQQQCLNTHGPDSRACVD